MTKMMSVSTTRLILAGLALGVSVSALAGCTDVTSSDPWNVDEDAPPPQIGDDGRWEAMDGPSLGDPGSVESSGNLIGASGERLYLSRDVDPDADQYEVLEVRLEGGEAESTVIATGDILRGESNEPVRVARFDGERYLLTADATYRDDGDSWEELSDRFTWLGELDGELIGRTATEQLVRRTGDDQWETLREDVSKVALVDDIIHIQEGISDEYFSTDGGESWQEHDAGPGFEFLFDQGVVSYDGEFFAARDSTNKPLVRSSDGVDFEMEGMSGTDAGLSALHVHDGELLGLTDEEPRRLLSYDSEGDRWSEVTIEEAPGFSLNAMESIDDTLVVEVDGAGLWRTRDLDTWRPVGPPVSEPSATAVLAEGVCAYGGVQNLATCKSSGDGDWKYYGSADEEIEAMHVDRGRVFIVREIDGGNELLRLDATEGLSKVMDGTLGLSETTGAFEWRGDTWVVSRDSGLHRVSGNDELERVDHRLSDGGSPSVVTPFDDELWLTTYHGDTWRIRSSSDADDWMGVDDGLPDPNDHDGEMRPPYPAQVVASDAHIYAIVSFPEEDAEPHRSYRWSPDDERWVETSMPDEEALDGDRLRGFAGGERGLYAASHSDVFQYDPSTDRWRTLSRGLEGKLRPGTLAAGNGQLLVGSWGRGLYAYTE